MSTKMHIFYILAPINMGPVPANQYPGLGTSSGTRDPGLSPGPADIPTPKWDLAVLGHILPCFETSSAQNWF